MKRLPLLVVSHLGFLALIGLYLSVLHPGCAKVAAAFFLTGLLVEWFPRHLKRPLFPELLGLAVACLGWWQWLPAADPTAFHGGAGMVLAYCVLIPSRVGRLKWVLGLALAELVWMGALRGSAHAHLLAIPLGLAALGVDGWLLDVIPGRAREEEAQTGLLASLLRWVMAPLLIMIAATGLLGRWAVETAAAYHTLHPPATGGTQKPAPVLRGFDGQMVIGRKRTLERDPQVMARLTWDAGPPRAGMVYLRAMAVSDLILDGTAISWREMGGRRLQEAHPPDHTPVRWARVQRRPSSTDVVFRLDGGEVVDLEDLLSDEDGNLYRRQFGADQRNYRVESDEQLAPADPGSAARSRALDPRLATLPWDEIEDPRWRKASPEQAAKMIGDRLQEHCQYDLANLPAPAPGAGGVLRGFLFGAAPELRRGHCQYFATAAALLLRRAGHRARCVVGFASDEHDGNAVIFRALHAHAWIEVVNSQGRWQRFDPTPAVRNERILEGVEIPPDLPETSGAGPDAAGADDEEAVGSSGFSWNSWPVVLGVSLGAPLVGWLYSRMRFCRAPRPPRRRREALLQRQSEALLAVAEALGIPVRPATTLSELVEALERRTGVALHGHLEAHLAARFGQGPLPDPWPIATLRSHGKQARSR